MNPLSYQTATVPEASEAMRSGPIKAQPGALSIHADGTSTTSRPQSLNTTEFRAGPGILATARTRTGSPSMGGIKPTDIVTLDEGFEVSVETAEHMGALTRDASGRYVEVQGGVEAAKEQANAPKDAPIVDDAVAFAAPDAEANLTSLCEVTGPDLQVKALNELVKGNEITENTLNRAASESGVEPSALAVRVEAVKAAFSAQAEASVAAHGVEDAAGLWEWARTHHPKELQTAMRTHGMERSPRGYAPLAQEYVASIAEHDPESVLNAKFGSGITARKDGKQVVLDIAGAGTMTVRKAIKNGLIKVSGA